MYGGSLTLISAIDSFSKVRPTATVRIVTIVVTAVLSLVPALLIGADFLTNFEDFLLLVLYLFIPWTAVNLVDYYIVRRGHYAIAEIFNPRGLYGRWGWRGIAAYLLGFAAMLPFLSTSKYTGFVANDLKGADISMFVGLPVAGLLYFALRQVDRRRGRDGDRQGRGRGAGEGGDAPPASGVIRRPGDPVVAPVTGEAWHAMWGLRRPPSNERIKRFFVCRPGPVPSTPP